MRRRLLTGAAALALPLLTGCGSTRIHVSNEVDVSQALGPQLETAIAVDPHDPNVLVAGSNTLYAPTMQVYGSIDGGRGWVSAPGPPLLKEFSVGASDPSVAIDPHGR